MQPEIKAIRESTIPLSLKDLESAFPHRGRSAINMSMRRAVEKGLIKKTEHGKYAHPSLDTEAISPQCSIPNHHYQGLIALMTHMAEQNENSAIRAITDFLFEDNSLPPADYRRLVTAWKEGAPNTPLTGFLSLKPVNGKDDCMQYYYYPWTQRFRVELGLEDW